MTIFCRKFRHFSCFLIPAIAFILNSAPVHPSVGAQFSSVGGGKAITRQETGIGYAYKLYDSTNGLPTSEAESAIMTSDGFLWIGGYSGLIRYDGTTFVRQELSEYITNAYALFEDSKKRLWIGMNENGVVMVDKDKCVKFSEDEGLKETSVRSITEDENGTIYIGTPHGISYIENDMKVHPLDDDFINNEYITRLETGKDGIIYGSTWRGNAFCIKEKKVTEFYSGATLGIGQITTLYPDPRSPGTVYIGTDSDKIYRGRLSDKPSTFEKISVSPATNVTWITYASGRIWVLSDTTAGYIDTDGSYKVLDNLPLKSAIGKLTEDYEGNIWITSFRHGVLKIVANKFTDLSERAGLEKAVANSTCLHDGRLYIGTDRGLQIIDENEKPVQNEETEFIGSARIRCIMEDKSGNLWVSVYNENKGLVCFEKGGQIRSYTEKDGLLCNEIRSTTLTKNGEILVATNSGLNVMKDGIVTKSYGVNNGLSHTVILSVIEGEKEGRYYIGTDGGGIYIIDGNNIMRKGRKDGLMSEVILRLKYDELRKIYWIVTSNSIAYMKDGEITTLTHFPYPNNYDVYFDDTGNVWVLASNGIYIAKISEILKNEKFDYLFYDRTRGLQSMPTGNSYSATDSNGNLYLACRNGAIRVNINRYFEKVHDIKIAIPYVEADGKKYYADDDMKIVIPKTAKSVTIFSYALTYSLQNPKIMCQLEGFDKEPKYLTKNEMEPSRYTNLSGGTYTYTLSVLNNSTNKVQQTVTLKIIKEKMIYEKTWFWILTTLITLLVSTLCLNRYINKRMKAERQKAEDERRFKNEIICAFANCVDGKDNYTNGHSERVAKYTKMLAKKLGENRDTVEKFYNIARLHDIGKIGIPDEILKKPGKLSDEEFAIMKSHAIRGYEILKDVHIQEDLAAGAHYHHERYDGKGYPDGLSGNDIPWVARIIAVADTFDAMSSTRPYRKQLPMDFIISEIQRCSGTQFDPIVVKKFMELYKEGAFNSIR